MKQSIDEVRYTRHGITREQAFNQENWMKGLDYAQSTEARELYKQNYPK